jgi:hypothetical protein
MYNVSDITYPFHLDVNLQAGLIDKMNGIYSFPTQFIPVWSASNVCHHGNVFDHDDGNLGRHSQNIVVYTNIGERVFDVKIMYRNKLG